MPRPSARNAFVDDRVVVACAHGKRQFVGLGRVGVNLVIAVEDVKRVAVPRNRLPQRPVGLLRDVVFVVAAGGLVDVDTDKSEKPPASFDGCGAGGICARTAHGGLVISRRALAARARGE